MRAANSLLKKIREFPDDTSGTVFVIAAASIFAIAISAGAAIDYSRMVSKKSKMDGALDAAILAAGVEMSKGVTNRTQIQVVFENFLFANLESMGDFGTTAWDDVEISQFSADPDTGEVSAQIQSSVDASIMQIAGYDELDIASSASVVFDQTDVEVAMMLDVTGSMRGQKITDLKLAAKDAVDILIPDNNTRGVRIGLVPYATSVNAGLQLARRVTRGNTNTFVAGPPQFTTSQNVATNGCVTGRGGRDAATDVSYRVAPVGSDNRTVNNPNSALRCPSAEVQPLTNNRNRLRSQIDRYSAAGWTAGHLGVAWSYYLLSENWRDAYSIDSKPAAYSADVQKIAILMTDGAFNTAYEGITTGSPFGVNTALSNRRATDLCDDMKQLKSGNPGIVIYSIAFQAPASAEATLRACANTDTADTTYYYSADNGQQLREAFRKIAGSIMNLRLSK